MSSVKGGRVVVTFILFFFPIVHEFSVVRPGPWLGGHVDATASIKKWAVKL